MLVDQLDELLDNRPFKPFVIYTADGREFRVKSHEFVWHPPASRMVWVYADQGDKAHLIDLHLVASVTVEGNGHPPVSGTGTRE
jgi:hypothetical protein